MQHTKHFYLLNATWGINILLLFNFLLIFIVVLIFEI